VERIGFILTLIWLSLIGTLIFLKWNDAQSMALNEWGDFLAGVTAPIAFLWLIVGYFLQRKELSSNTQALKEQGQELKEHAKFLKRSAEAAESQASSTATAELREALGLYKL